MLTIYGLSISQWLVFLSDGFTIAGHLATNPTNPIGVS
jgi:hypothetical protein